MIYKILLILIMSSGLYASEASHDDLFKAYIEALPKKEQVCFKGVNKLQKDDVSIYENKLVFRFYRRGFLMAYDGKVEKVLLKYPSPAQRSGKGINRIYRQQNAKKVLYAPREGPYMCFDDRFRYHIYSKGLIIFKAKAKKGMHQMIVLEKSFDK